MSKASNYQSRRVGRWRLTVLPQAWSDQLEEKVLELTDQQLPSKHPQTVEMSWPTFSNETRYFLKVFHRTSIGGATKDLFRASKAARFLRQGLALSDAGFKVPATVAAGELRRLGIFIRGFALTAKIDGEALPIYLARVASTSDGVHWLRTKRSGLKQLAELIRQLHDCGFVHGDLVASNLFVAADAGSAPTFYFMDNDRTRFFPSWLPQSRWKRNLIQLNRMPLPTITLQDRVRFLCAYLRRSRIAPRDRRLARWIEVKTRKRRYECDGVDPAMNFRRLMRWRPDAGVTPEL
jgi:Lipopolysaccharide kinase (Kdo/WaaP) family